MRHECEGDDCGYCEQRISEIEYEREFGDDDLPQYWDGTGRA